MLANSAVFPGMQDGPLEHVIAAKTNAFQEARSDELLEYRVQMVEHNETMAA